MFGLLILYRSTTPGVGPSTGNKDEGLFMFQAVAWSVFVISMGAQVLGQTSLVGGPALFIRNVVGFALFPIYLDGEHLLLLRWWLWVVCAVYGPRRPPVNNVSSFACPVNNLNFFACLEPQTDIRAPE